MVSLKSLLGKLFDEIAKARELADLEAVRLAELYPEKPRKGIRKIKISLDRIEETVKEIERTTVKKKK